MGQDTRDGAAPVRDRRRTIHAVAGPAVFLVLVAAPLGGLPYEVRCSLGLLFWMALWWITRPVHLAVTGFLPLATLSLFPVPVGHDGLVVGAHGVHAGCEELGAEDLVHSSVV